MSRAPPGGDASIEFRGACHSYDGGRSLAVHPTHLTIREREFVAIVGTSGSGKTTLLKMVNRLLEPHSGEILVGGRSNRDQPPAELRRRIGYVFQGIGLFPHLTVGENIGITPRLLGWPNAEIAARVAALMTLIELPVDAAERYPAGLSGGQRQRVGVARALAARPAILLMDEPFGALDPVTRDALGTRYRALHDELGLATMMVTHDVLEATLLADRIVVMRDGAIVADGTPAQLLASSADAGARALLDMPRRQAERVASRLQRATSDE